MSVERPLRVPYNIPGSPYWQWVNIYQRLSQDRILFLDETITDWTANKIISSLLYLDSEDQNKPIYLYINSFGDLDESGTASIPAGLAIYDTMQHIKSEIATICIGQALGMAALLLSSGTKGRRASLPHAMLALGFPQSRTRGQVTDIQIDAKEMLAKRSLVLSILAGNTGQSVEEIAKDTDRMLYLTPQQAKEYGLIDKVLESPKLSVPEPALT